MKTTAKGQKKEASFRGFICFSKTLSHLEWGMEGEGLSCPAGRIFEYQRRGSCFLFFEKSVQLKTKTRFGIFVKKISAKSEQRQGERRLPVDGSALGDG